MQSASNPNTTQNPSSAGSALPVKRVVIAGGGTAGWMAAAMLSHSLGRVCEITLVESDEIGTVGVGEATIPTLMTFHHLLGINEQAFMSATNATFKLGISFENWRNLNEDYIHSFGSTGTDHWTAGFQHFWLKGRQRGLAGDYGDYCLELKAAEANRFAHLPKNGMNYAYHLDAGLYAKFLRNFSEPLGVKRVEGQITKVNLGDNGHITSLTLNDGSELPGDLFIDCSGFRALLIGQAMQVPYEDWSHLLFCDSALAVQTESAGELLPYTRAIARQAGWQWRIPLQNRVGNGLVYSSRYISDDEARSTLLSNLAAPTITEPRTIRFKPGQREVTWKGNCVAIGLASGFLEPVESTSIHLIQRGLVRLMQLFPSQGINPADVAEYNAQTRYELGHIRDFIILHYHVTNRTDTPFWRDCRSLEVPASLRHRISLFSESARVFRAPNELFAENSWIQVMLGQGITPAQHHQSADLMGDAELSDFLGTISTNVQQTVRRLPPHADYVRQFCGLRA